MIRRILRLLLIGMSLAACAGQPGQSRGSTQPTQNSPSSAASLPSAPLFALSTSERSIIIIDSATHQVVKTITHPDLFGAREFAVTPEGMLYIALSSDPTRVYDELLVVDAHRGEIVTRFATANAPMTPRWIGSNTVLLAHTSYEPGGFDVVLIDTQYQTMTQRLKRPEIMRDAVTIGETVYMAEEGQGNGASIVAYDLTTGTIGQTFPVSQTTTSIVLADDHHLYMAINGKPDSSGVPCNLNGGTIARLDLTTGSVEPVGTLRLPAAPNGLVITPDKLLIFLDTCVDADHARITAVDSVTGTERASILVERTSSIAMSPVTPQGEIAVFLDSGRVLWYDATTLEARGQSAVPVSEWIDSALLYPTETKVRK